MGHHKSDPEEIEERYFSSLMSGLKDSGVILTEEDFSSAFYGDIFLEENEKFTNGVYDRSDLGGENCWKTDFLKILGQETAKRDFNFLKVLLKEPAGGNSDLLQTLLEEATEGDSEFLELLIEEVSQNDSDSFKSLQGEFNKGDSERLNGCVSTVTGDKFRSVWLGKVIDYFVENPFFEALEDYSENNFLADLEQARLYMNDSGVKDAIQDRFQGAVTEDTAVVIGHSLGSVIAYECLCKYPHSVDHFVTIGSPLGQSQLFFGKLEPKPDGRWPSPLRDWTNVASPLDVIATPKKLTNRFGDRVQDKSCSNNVITPHYATEYLKAEEVLDAVVQGVKEL